MDIGNRIYSLRKKTDLTQEQLAEKLQISRQSVTKWESNDSIPDVGKLVELSQIFQVSIDYLIKGSNQYSKHGDAIIDDLLEIKEFLCTAKKNTYAAYGAETVSSRLGSHDLRYENGSYSYLDSYFGGEKFIGEELVYIESIPFWSMNYLGRVLDPNFSGDFLKECLMAVDEHHPYRGPDIYQNGNFTYQCNVRGTFDWFMGDEVIFFQNQKVYECVFHGGIIT
jgi:transcriptional regulator with XRE-family HTH domain